MIKSKILYGLCIAALGLPFAEAMETMPNWSNNDGDKPVRAPHNENKESIKKSKKRVRSNDQMMDRSGNGNGGSVPCYQAPQQNPGGSQYNNSLYNQNFVSAGITELKKLDKSKDCNLFDNIEKVEIQHNGRNFVLDINVVMFAVYLRNVKMLSHKNIVNVLYLMENKEFAFWEASLDAIYTYVDADKIWRRDIVDSIRYKSRSIRAFLRFKAKLCSLNVEGDISKALVNDLIQDIEMFPDDVVKNDAYRANDFTVEQIKTIKFLSSTGLKDAEVVEIFNGLFNSGDIFNNNICDVVAREHSSKNEGVHFFYEIDDWLYLTDSDKEKIKNKLLQCETTWEKVAKFLSGVCLFDRENILRIVSGTFSNFMLRQGSIPEDITANLRLDEMHDLDNIDQKDLVVDLASLGLLEEIGSHIDGNKIKEFKDRFKTWIDRMPDEDGEKNAFIEKLKGYKLGILGECVGKDEIKIDVCHTYTKSKVLSRNERDKIKSYLQTLKLSNEKRLATLNVIFYSDFYEIDKLSYLDDEAKGKIKKKLLGLTITWQEAARFLLDIYSADDKSESLLYKDEIAKIINEVFDDIFKNTKQITKSWDEIKWYDISNLKNRKNDEINTRLYAINIKDIALDLASLGVLEKIVSYIDDHIDTFRDKVKVRKGLPKEEKKNVFKAKFKSWIDELPDEDGEKNAFIEKLGGYKLGILGECVGQKANNNAKDVMEIENINRNLNDKNDKENGMEIESDDEIEPETIEIEIE